MSALKDLPRVTAGRLATGLAGFACLAPIIYWGWIWWQGPTLGADQVIRSDFVHTIVASGHVQSPDRVTVGTQMTGTVAEVLVLEGQEVQAHQVLIAINSEEATAAQEQADGALAQSLAKLRQISEVQAPVAAQALRQAHIHLVQANAALERNQDLFAKAFISKVMLDDAHKALEVADAQWQAAHTQWATTGPDGSDFALALAGLAQAKANVQAARLRSHYALVRAPVGGVVLTLNAVRGDLVVMGKALATLSPTGQPQLVVAIDEKNLGLIAVGQSALASTEAYPKQTFGAQVLSIHPGVNAQTGSIEVKLGITQPPAYLRQDMTVSVDIEVARRPHALLVPMAAVYDINGPRPWVMAVNEGRLQKKSLHLGLRAGGMAEVLAGLQEGDWVVNSPSKLQVGARVRTVAVANSINAPP
jgi:HlyD family secretion protein